jgi:RNA polymerase-associated protein CTR9
MGRNTLRRQLERAMQQQKEYEQENFDKLEEARRAREEAARIKHEKAEQAATEERERQLKLAAERQEMQEKAQEWAETARAQLLAQQEEATSLKRKSKKKKSVKDGMPSDEEVEGSVDETEGERPKRKRRKIARANALSQEKVFDSESEAEDSAAVSEAENRAGKKKRVLSQARIVDSDDEEMLDDVNSMPMNDKENDPEDDLFEEGMKIDED